MSNVFPRSAYLGHPGVKVLAHRGLCFANEERVFDENSQQSFDAALAAGLQFIETDLQLSKDAVPIIFHDETLSRVAGDSRRVSDLTFAELQQLPLKLGCKLISLGQALTEFPQAKFNIDIKTLEVAIPAAAVINRLDCHDRVLISSFSDRNRKACVAAILKPVATSPGARTIFFAFLLHTIKATHLLKKLLSGFAAVQIPMSFSIFRFDRKSFISRMHSIGLEVHFWTINDIEVMRRLLALGADGIVSDRSDLALKAL